MCNPVLLTASSVSMQFWHQGRNLKPTTQMTLISSLNSQKKVCVVFLHKHFCHYWLQPVSCLKLFFSDLILRSNLPTGTLILFFLTVLKSKVCLSVTPPAVYQTLYYSQRICSQ